MTRHECAGDSKVEPRHYHPDLGKPDAPPKKPHEDDNYLRDNTDTVDDKEAAK